MKLLTIGKLAELTGVNVETVRYYERIGILPPPPRSEGGQRRYGESHLQRLRFVRRCRDLGFTLEDIRALLDMADGGSLACEQVRDLASRHLAGVRSRIADLKRMEETLDEMVNRCGGDIPDCAIIEALFAGPDGDHAPSAPANPDSR